MYAVSDLFNEVALTNSRKFEVRMTLNGNQVLTGLNIESFSLTEHLNGTNGISMGEVCSAQMNVSLFQTDNKYAFEGGYFTAEVGLHLEDGTVEYCPLGTFFVSEVNTKTGYEKVNITAYDGAYKLEKAYSPNIAEEDFPASIQSVAEDIASQCGVLIASDTVFPDYIIPWASFEEKYTCKQMIGFIAGMMGTNACFNRDGKLCFRFYTNAGLHIDLEHQWQGQMNLEKQNPISISAILTGTEEKPISAGSGTAISFSNPFITQEIADAIVVDLNNVSFSPLTVKWRGNPALEIGDIVSVERPDGSEITALVMEQDLKIGGGMNSTLKSFGSSEVKNTLSKSPTEEKLQKTYTTLAQALLDATKQLTGASGGYVKDVFDESGFRRAIAIVESNVDVVWRNGAVVALTNEPINMWVWNNVGLAHSKDSGVTYRDVAITMDGQINANAITTGMLNAGRLAVLGNNSLNDYFKVQQEDSGDISIQLGSSNNEILLKQISNKIAFCDKNGTELAFFTNESFEINNLQRFRLGNLSIIKRDNGNYSFAKVGE